MKRRLVVTFLLMAVLVGVGFALNRGNAPTVAAGAGPEITVYNGNLALVKERRTLDLDAGLNRVQISDVPARIQPDSVDIRSVSDPEGLLVIEQGFVYDLASTYNVLQKYIGREVRVTTGDGSVYVGRLLSVEGDIMLAPAEGGIVILKQDHVQKLELADLPEGLVTRPTLTWLVEAAQAGRQEVELTYLTQGLSWQAHYVVRLAADERRLDLNGWVTVDNQSGASYEEATLKLVAGEISRAAVTRPVLRVEVAKAVEAVPTPAPGVAERAFFEYHVYEVERPVTLPNNQSKQIAFIRAAGVPATKRYVLRLTDMAFRGGIITEPEVASKVKGNPDVYIEFKADENSGLDRPLPAGVVRVYKEDIDGSVLLVGETSIGHTPVGETVRLRVGRAFDIVGERTQTDFTKLGPRALEEAYEVVLRNQKDEDVTVRVVEPLFRSSDWEIVEASHEYTQADAHTIYFDVPVPAGDEVTVTYTVRYRW